MAFVYTPKHGRTVSSGPYVVPSSGQWHAERVEELDQLVESGELVREDLTPKAAVEAPKAPTAPATPAPGAKK